MKLNPFKPNSPVSPGMFIGRISEITSLEQSLFQAQAASPTHFMITGERGIGKTSLLLYTRYLATGQLDSEDAKFNFLVIDLDIDARTTQLGIVKRIALQLKHTLGKSEPARKFLSTAWDFVQRVSIQGTGLSQKSDKAVEDELLLDELVISLSDTVSRLTSNTSEASVFSAKFDGVLILIDEADNASPEFSIGSFLKLLVERLQRRDCNRVLIGLAGLPELRAKLLSSHPSSLRIFREITLERLSPEEVGKVVDVCIDRANKDNAIATTITDGAKNLLSAFSEGFPHFIQQFGHSAFEIDQDNIIDEKDIIQSALISGGALEAIGDRYYRDDFYNKIQTDDYRQVLEIMAEDLDSWVPRAKIRAKFKGDGSTLNNAIKALRDRHIILSKEGTKGVYRLQHRGFALWIMLQSARFQKSVEKKQSGHNSKMSKESN